MKVGFMVVVAISAVVLAVAVLLPSTVDANRDSSRYDAHGRSIDIDICIRCDSPIPGPPGPQGPQGEQGPPGPAGPTPITVVTLEDNDAGHAAGWNPPGNEQQLYTIQSPVDLQKGTLIELSFTNPSDNPAAPSRHGVGDCRAGAIDISSNSFSIGCHLSQGFTPVEGATLTYIITEP